MAIPGCELHPGIGQASEDDRRSRDAALDRGAVREVRGQASGDDRDLARQRSRAYSI